MSALRFISTRTTRSFQLIIKANYHQCRPLAAIQHRVSSLYVSNEIAQHTSPVQPDLDLPRIIANLNELTQNLRLRGSLDMDLATFSRSYQRLMELRTRIDEIENARKENSEEMKKLIGNNDNSSNERTEAELREEGKKLKNSLKPLVNESRNLEEEVMLTALILPNRLEPDTESDDSVFRQKVNTQERADQDRSHMEIIPPDRLQFQPTSPGSVYLMGELASLEHALISYITERLDRAGYISISPPHIFKTLVAEGCAFDLDRLHELAIKAPALHNASDKVQEYSRLEHGQYLAGLSPMSMAAFLARSTVDNASLPLRFQSIGTGYRKSSGGKGDDLYSSNVQTSGIQITLTVAEDSQCSELFEEARELLWSIYADFDIPLTLSRVGARNLSREESSRYDLLCRTRRTKQRVALASISRLGDYTSRRLMMRVGGKNIRHHAYHHIVHGDILNAQMLMAAILEYHAETDGVRIPAPLLEHWIGPMPSGALIFSNEN